MRTRSAPDPRLKRVKQAVIGLLTLFGAKELSSAPVFDTLAPPQTIVVKARDFEKECISVLFERKKKCWQVPVLIIKDVYNSGASDRIDAPQRAPYMEINAQYCIRVREQKNIFGVQLARTIGEHYSGACRRPPIPSIS